MFSPKDNPQTSDKIALNFIRDVCVVEHDAIAAGVAGTDEHRRIRQARTGVIMARLMTWLEAQRHVHPPKSTMGSAAAYTLNHWTELTLFIENPGITLDNKRSESALRVIPLGRKNILFVGHEQAARTSPISTPSSRPARQERPVG